MLGKLNKTEEKQLEAAIATLSEAVEAVEYEMGEERECADEQAWQEERSKFLVLLERMVESATPAVSFFEDIVNDQRDQFSEKSERWQESDKASTIDSWIGTLEDIASFSGYEALDMAEGLEMPEEWPAKVRFSESIDVSEYRDLLDSLEAVERQAE